MIQEYGAKHDKMTLHWQVERAHEELANDNQSLKRRITQGFVVGSWSLTQYADRYFYGDQIMVVVIYWSLTAKNIANLQVIYSAIMMRSSSSYPET